MQIIRKILRAVSEKTALPINHPTNNQPVITNNADLIGHGADASPIKTTWKLIVTPMRKTEFDCLWRVTIEQK